MTKVEIQQKISEKLTNLTEQELSLIEKLVTDITSYFDNKSNLETTDNDPFISLKNSDFIGCFTDESDLAEKSEQLVHSILANKKV